MIIRDLLASAAQDISMRDAELFLAAALEQERPWLRAHPEADVEGERERKFRTDVQRRSAGEPLQYVLGVQEFFGLPLRVTPAVLIPRPETEHLVEAVLVWAGTQPGRLRIMDVGTGSGAIALALASKLPEAEITATDLSGEALEVAKVNAKYLGLDKRVQHVRADLLSNTTSASLDAVVSNPPYVPSADAATMQREVVEHEPHAALFAGTDGLDVYRRLIPQAQAALRQAGLLAMEIGFGQSDALRKLLSSWREVRFVEDYAGIPRVVLALRA